MRPSQKTEYMAFLMFSLHAHKCNNQTYIRLFSQLFCKYEHDAEMCVVVLKYILLYIINIILSVTISDFDISIRLRIVYCGFKLLQRWTFAQNQIFTYSYVLHSHTVLLQLCPCGRYRQLNSYLYPNNHILKSSKIIFNRLVLKEV